MMLMFQVGFEMMDRELLWHGFAVSIVQQSIMAAFGDDVTAPDALT